MTTPRHIPDSTPPLGPRPSPHSSPPSSSPSSSGPNSGSVTRSTRSIENEVEQIAADLHSIKSHMGQASDLAETGALASMYAHEVNNLMTQVGGRAQLALMHMDQPERIIHALELACHASVQIAQLSEIFMGHANASSQPDPSPSITDIHHRALGFLPDQDIARYGCSITGSLKIEPAIPAAMLQQVLLNLYLNAIRAIKASDQTRPGRLITVIESIEPNPAHTPTHTQCSTWNTPQGIRITVQDTGVGMCSDQLAGLFTTTERGGDIGSSDQSRGHGLGLMICDRLISNAQGSIIAESTPGAGTKIIITLPIASSSDRDQAAA